MTATRCVLWLVGISLSYIIVVFRFCLGTYDITYPPLVPMRESEFADWMHSELKENWQVYWSKRFTNNSMNARWIDLLFCCCCGIKRYSQQTSYFYSPVFSPLMCSHCSGYVEVVLVVAIGNRVYGFIVFRKQVVELKRIHCQFPSTKGHKKNESASFTVRFEYIPSIWIRCWWYRKWCPRK